MSVSEERYNYRFETVSFVPDALGWRVAVAWDLDGTEHRRVVPVVGWLVREERRFDSADLEATSPTGVTEVEAGVINTWDGGEKVIPVSDLWTVFVGLDFQLLPPGESKPEGYQSRAI